MLKNGHKALPGAKESLLKLMMNNVNFRIVTNGGGELEAERAIGLNKILDLQNSNIIKGNQVILCHTPLKMLLPTHKDKMIIATGVGDLVKILTSYGFKRFITVDEYCQLYRQSISQFMKTESPEQRKLTYLAVEKRLGIKFSDKIHEGKGGLDNDFLKFDSVLTMTDVSRWERSVQVLCDILISKDGIPGSIRTKDEKQVVDMHAACKDLVYKDSFSLNRIANGGFVISLETIFKKLYHQEIQYKIYGKPSRIIFDYAIEDIRKEHNCERFYMIGDNPEVDIKGANNSGIKSVLLRTGVWHKHHNCPENPASYIVNGVKDAVDLILDLEKVKSH